MIQRIQTLYLALATFLSGMMLKGTIVELLDKSGTLFKLVWNGLIQENQAGVSTMLEQSIPLSIITIIVPLLFFVAIFLFKRRKLQLRITILATLLLIGELFLVIYYIWYAGTKLEADFIFKIRLIFPPIGSIFGYLAFRGILKDELLIKSYDRLR